ncbi:hypothetical protein MNBD_ALPHA06-655 [hydrothermal vent metagenome]|uniref:DUF1800 domain-containing protein n=1 Tax=hydrothermal vent metagenome TaxID=652676 RepID=A0A3B0S2X3_9ZZZZ
MADLNALIAAHKFGLGAKAGETTLIGETPQAWLQAQLTEVVSTLDEFGLPSAADGIALFYEFQLAKRQENNADQPLPGTSVNKKDQLTAFVADIDRMKSEQMLIEDNGVRGSGLNDTQNTYLQAKKSNLSKPAGDKTSQELLQEMVALSYDDIGVRTLHAAITPASFREALVRFWTDHFNVFSEKSLLVRVTAGAMEREAIRPNVTGKFFDMLVAVETHPSMLFYLDNWLSIGPNSYVGQKFTLGLNENLARETLELHTLGVGAGYTQDDIISYAKAITGWSVGNPQIQPEKLGSFIFEPLFHEPGPVTFLNKLYPGTAQDQGLAILADLAVHDKTAGFIATKLARHFHSDTPPQSLIDRLELSFKSSGGDLLVVSSTLVSSPEMWDGSFAKLRNSEEFVVATLRAFGFDSLTSEQSVFVFNAVAQVPFTYHAPEGWPKDEASWASSSILSARLNYANLLARFIALQPEPSTAAQDILGPVLGTKSIDGISQASDVEQGYALMMMSPEFQRR